MWPQFQENEILIIDTHKSPKNRDYVVGYIEDTKEVLFRQLILEGGLYVLKPINPDFPMIHIKNQDKVIGVVTQTIKKC